MLGLGWTEMLVIGVVALIFIGPKDLPVVMGRVGKVIGQIQRMGRDFQREINRTTGLDEVRNLRTSITSPLKKTAEEIRKDFNAIGKDGKEQPTGALKPTDPNTESVVDAIQQQAGLAPATKKISNQLAADCGFKPAAAQPIKPEPVKAKRATAKRPAARSAKAEAEKVKPAAKARVAKPTAKTDEAPRKPAAPKAARSASAKADTKPAAKPRAPRNKPADAAGKSE